MSSSNVLNGATFNAPSDFKYTAPKANKSGGKSVGIQSTKDNKSLHLSTPTYDDVGSEWI